MDIPAEKIVPLEFLGDQDAMVVMRSKDDELAFVFRWDMPEDGYIKSCVRLRELMIARKKP